MSDTGGDITCDVLENLELFERSLLDYEDVLRSGQEDVSLVHIMFRYAHNSKGGLAVLGRTNCTHLVHAVEACFDGIRNGVLSGTLGLVEQSLQAISALRQALEGGEDPAELEELAHTFVELCDGLRPSEQVARNDEIPFALTQDEQQTIASLPATANLYLIDKSVRNSLTEAAFLALPIFEDIQAIGSLVAQRPAFAEFPPELPEVVVRMLVASEQNLDEVSGYIFDPIREIQRPAQQTKAAPRNTTTRVLIAEDEFTSRQILYHFLNTKCDVDVASNGAEAVAAVKAAFESGHPYTLICLDIMMPKLNGQEVLKQIRSFEAEHGVMGLDGVKVIMATSLEDGPNLFGAFRAGCEGYLVKPIDRSKLFALLKKLGMS